MNNVKIKESCKRRLSTASSTGSSESKQFQNGNPPKKPFMDAPIIGPWITNMDYKEHSPSPPSKRSASANPPKKRSVNFCMDAPLIRDKDNKEYSLNPPKKRSASAYPIKKPFLYTPMAAPPRANKEANKEHSHVFESVNESCGGPVSNKSLADVSIRWLFGGLFAWHHLYLGRRLQAVIWLFMLLHKSMPFGFLCIGLIADLILMPEYLEAANDADLKKYGPEHRAKRKAEPSPPRCLRRCVGQVLMGCLFGAFSEWAIASLPDDYFFMRWHMPLAVSLAVWVVGNIGRQKGFLWPAAGGAYAAYLPAIFIPNAFCASILIASASTLSFNWFAKKWRTRPAPRLEVALRHRVFFVLFLGICVAQSWYSQVMDSQGKIVDLIDQLRGFLMQIRLLKTLNDVLDIASAFRKLAEIYHPEGQTNPYAKNNVQAQWNRIRAAYERLLLTLYNDETFPPNGEEHSS